MASQVHFKSLPLSIFNCSNGGSSVYQQYIAVPQLLPGLLILQHTLCSVFWLWFLPMYPLKPPSHPTPLPPKTLSFLVFYFTVVPGMALSLVRILHLPFCHGKSPSFPAHC